MIYKQSQSGFSLVETLVAITILLIVIVGPLSIISSAANSTMFASDQVTAFLLAQEGVELVQKARDDLVIGGFSGDVADPWGTFTNINGNFRHCYDLGCGLEITSEDDGSLGSVMDCSGNTANVEYINCKLYLSDDTNDRSKYTHVPTGNTNTNFFRMVTLSRGANLYEVKVVSRVWWFSGVTRNEREVVVETYLFDIYGN